jgi:hypothetical protein
MRRRTEGFLSHGVSDAEVDAQVRLSFSGFLTNPETSLMWEEIRTLRAFVDEKGEAATFTPLYEFVSVVSMMTQAFGTIDGLIAQPASKRLGVNRLGAAPLYRSTVEILDGLDLGPTVAALRDRLVRIRSTRRDQAILNLTQPDSSFRYVTAEGDPTLLNDESLIVPTVRATTQGLFGSNTDTERKRLARATTAYFAAATQNVSREMSALRAVDFDRKASIRPIRTPRSLIRALSVASDATDVPSDQIEEVAQAVGDTGEALAEVGTILVQRGKTAEAEALFARAENFRAARNLFGDPDAADSPFRRTDPDEGNNDNAPASPGNARASININVDAAGIGLDANAIRELMQDDELQRQQEIENSMQRAAVRARREDDALAKERTTWINKVLDVLSDPAFTGKQRPSAKLLAGMQRALAQIVMVNPTFRKLAAQKRFAELYAHRDGNIVTRFAELTASFLITAGGFSKYQSQVAAKTKANDQAMALLFFKMSVYYDGRRVQNVPEGETTQSMGLVRGRQTIGEAVRSRLGGSALFAPPFVSYECTPSVQPRRIYETSLGPKGGFC